MASFQSPSKGEEDLLLPLNTISKGNYTHPVNLDDHSGTSIRSQSSDVTTYNTMLQLSSSHNPLRYNIVRKCTIFLAGSCVLFLTNQLMTLPVGFFPSYARDRLGFSSTQLSLFFALYPVCIMASSPLAALWTPAIGRQTVLCLGLITSGTATVAFAYSSSTFLVFCLRMLQGIGAGAAVVGSVSMLTEEFPDSVGHAMVLQEVVAAVAFISAPPMGSFLYDYQGFQLPFLASGVAQLLTVMVMPLLFVEYALPDGMYDQVPISPSCLPMLLNSRLNDAYGDHSDVSTTDMSFRTVLTPTCVFCLLLTSFAMTAFGFIDPYLGGHLKSVLGVEHVTVGLGFALSALVYSLGTLIYAWVAYCVGRKQVIVFGVCQLAIGFFLLGPPPFLRSFFIPGADDETHKFRLLWVSQMTALICIGCGAALSTAPALSVALRDVNSSQPSAANSPKLTLVVGLFSAAIYLGQAVGPMLALLFQSILPATTSPSCDPLGMAVCEKDSLPWSFTAYACLAMALAALVGWKLPVNDNVVHDKVVKPPVRRRMSFNRQPSIEYGQYVFLDDSD